MNQKILLVGWGYPPKIDGGLDIHVKHLFDELLEQGINVDLALPEERAPDRNEIIPVETGEGDMIQKSRRMSAEVAKISEDYDIVHTHDWFGAEAGFKSRKYSETNWVSTLHSLSSSRSRQRSEELENLEKVAAEKPDKSIAVSKKLAKEVETEFGVEPEVIHNGFSKPERSGIDVKKKHNIKGDIIFFVGRHAEQKGLEHLLYGFRKITDNREATLVIGGEGHMTEVLKKFSEILDIKEKTVFPGFIPREELGDYYSAADVFVSPSINEPFGLTITEALETGTPVVATDNGVSEIAGESIIPAEPESDSIKRGIEKALDQEREVEYDTRSWKEMTDEILDVYRNLSNNS